jgi:hypothetical protein
MLCCRSACSASRTCARPAPASHLRYILLVGCDVLLEEGVEVEQEQLVDTNDPLG